MCHKNIVKLRRFERLIMVVPAGKRNTDRKLLTKILNRVLDNIVKTYIMCHTPIIPLHISGHILTRAWSSPNIYLI